jgi:hypothetical protein
MNHRILIGLLLTVPAAAGCFQELDTGVARGGPAASTFGDASSAPTPSQCDPGSQACFDLCGSPSCYTLVPDGSIPTFEQTPVIYDPLGDGSTYTSACAQIEAQSIEIRTHSCAQCHNKAVDQGSFNYVLDDSQLATQSSQNYRNDAGVPPRMIIPGDPANSWVYQRIAQKSMPPLDDGLIKVILGTTVAATVVRPTAAEQSVLYTWISNCIQGADGGAYSLSNYGAGGPYGPALGDGGASVSNASPAPAADAEAGAITDAGGGG